LRFAREVELVARVRHPHIVPVHGWGECDGHPYLIMGFVEGEDLRARLRRNGWLEPIEAADVVVQTAEALAELHRRGLVHRDVNPANILIAREGGHVYLSDFGLAKEIADARPLTRSGHWVGTYDYVAPEQIRGGRIDGRADIYALGCVLFEALTGQVPFECADTVARLWAHIHTTPRPIFPGSSSPFDEVIARAMAKRPQDRFPSAAEMARAALAAAARAYVFAAPPRSGPNRSVTVLERPALAAATVVDRYPA
jgi:serine/threonine-protein kinase